MTRDEVLSDRRGEGSAAVRSRVGRARDRQRERGQEVPNGLLGPIEARQIANLDGGCTTLLGRAIDRFGLSARACDRVIRVARTIADIGDSDGVEHEHLAEAIGYRVAQTRALG